MCDSKVITAGDEKTDPLIVATKKDGLDLNQLWILRAPDSDTNHYFVLVSAKTGLAMDVRGPSKDPGTHVQLWSRTNRFNQQFYWHQ